MVLFAWTSPHQKHFLSGTVTTLSDFFVFFVTGTRDKWADPLDLDE
jgi:hypothetical protein